MKPAIRCSPPARSAKASASSRPTATVVAPVSGVLQTVAETGHAFGIKTDDGVEVLVHVGIDTVKMNGEGFDVKVKADERVNAGDQRWLSVDFAKVKDAGYSTTTLMTVLNTAALTSVTPKTGIDVKAGDDGDRHPALTSRTEAEKGPTWTFFAYSTTMSYWLETAISEVILTGRGIGFQAKPGQHVDDAKIVRRFVPVRWQGSRPYGPTGGRDSARNHSVSLRTP